MEILTLWGPHIVLINAEFQRITNSLKTTFMVQLDSHLPQLTSIFQKEGGVSGQKLAKHLSILQEKVGPIPKDYNHYSLSCSVTSSYTMPRARPAPFFGLEDHSTPQNHLLGRSMPLNHQLVRSSSTLLLCQSGRLRIPGHHWSSPLLYQSSRCRLPVLPTAPCPADPPPAPCTAVPPPAPEDLRQLPERPVFAAGLQGPSAFTAGIPSEL
ncbi:uncharacterized protein LOC122881592 [Siniperca chuatsi]|uniref:uncharacterized protein LOC122881592 n=1 Tax=Siniperca chuatsi TaxID=119488 RepID=UPI001CE0E58E|nr:uncharacterized protein LOC122881592 [Siniperca chuatsi]XP_044063911.1 uncharacterized protein LOC122881592 [Siniperca chuatsi]